MRRREAPRGAYKRGLGLAYPHSQQLPTPNNMEAHDWLQLVEEEWEAEYQWVRHHDDTEAMHATGWAALDRELPLWAPPLTTYRDVEEYLDALDEEYPDRSDYNIDYGPLDRVYLLYPEQVGRYTKTLRELLRRGKETYARTVGATCCPCVGYVCRFP